jgi:molybdopterin-guanine dinucleotide biosynthesis protein A
MSPRSGPPPLAAVLAGGAATRLGGAKAAVELVGRPLISYPLEAFAQAGMAPIVVAKNDSELPALDVRVITEPDEPRHPLAGVIAALRHAGSRGALILPCDAPFVSPMLVRVLATATSTAAVRAGGRIHPLIAFYAFEDLSHLEAATAAGEPAIETLGALEPEWIEAPESETFNVNTPDDLNRAEDLLREPRS